MFRIIALTGALCLASSSIVLAQPDPATRPLHPVVKVDVVPNHTPVRLNVLLHDAGIVEALDEIAAPGNLQIIVKSDVQATVADLAIVNKSPEEALAMVCEAAHLSARFRKDVWIVSPFTAPNVRADTGGKLDMNFRGVEARALFEIISTQFDVPIDIKSDVKGTIPLIGLKGKTPREAIEAGAFAIDAIVTQDKDGTLIISAKTP